jgi:nitrous oxidase accessory protein NosD
MRHFQGTSLVAGVVVAALSAVSPAFVSADTHVVHPGQSIQAAVNAAEPGDTVVVKAGTYYQSVRISTNGLTLRARGHVTLKPPKYGDNEDECYLPGHAVGICIAPADFDPAMPTAGNPVSDVTVTGFRVVGFAGDGVFGVHTENLTVSEVEAIDNAAYGVASFNGIGTKFLRNSATGSHDAGIYVGDSPDANALVKDNRASGNALGILLRHVHNAIVSDNQSWGNCIGVFLLADGQDGGSGHIAVLNNTVVANNEVCTQFDTAGFLPVLGGGGIVLAGSQHNVVFQNVVRDNEVESGEGTIFSGGIVLVATPRPRSNGSFDESKNNLVFLNRARGNDPADIVKDEASTPNLIIANLCRTSSPSGLCGF